MYRNTPAPGIARPSFLLVILLTSVVLVPGDRALAQQLPETAAAKQLLGLLKCINLENAEDRKPFLKNQFSKEGDLQTSMEQRMEISSSLHERFAPLSVAEVLESEELKIVANCTTSQDVLLNVVLRVSNSEGHPITDIGMGPVESEVPESVPEGMLPLFDDQGKTVKEARGVWQARGYGYVFEVLEDSFQLYNVTESFAWKQDFEETLFFKPGENPDSAVVTMHALEPGYNLTRLSSLPPQCRAKSEWTSLELFDAFTQVFKEQYPFFDVRKVDWDRRTQENSPDAE